MIGGGGGMSEGEIGGVKMLGRSRVGSGLKEGGGRWAALNDRNSWNCVSKDEVGDRLGGAGVDKSVGGGGIAMKDKGMGTSRESSTVALGTLWGVSSKIENLSNGLGQRLHKGAIRVLYSSALWTSLPIKIRDGLDASGEKMSLER